MLKIRINEEIDDIKTLLSSIKNEVCIVHNRRKKDDFIVTSNANLKFIQTHLSVLEFEDFTEKDKVEFYLTDEDILIVGRAEYLQ
jgi:hypothetical protein